jgi:signal transduction histidine kinase
MSHPTVEQLRPIDLFDGLTDVELERFAQAAVITHIEAGAMTSEQGQPPRGLQLVLTGSLEALALDPDGRDEPVGEHVAPTWIGAIAVLTGGLSLVRMRALSDATLAVIEPETFIELVLAHRPVFDRVMRQVRPVVGRIAAMEQNRERLASLGTMAAGLAHELNNPASAAKSAAADLARALDVLGSTVGRFVESGVERAEARELVELQQGAMSQCSARSSLPAHDAAAAAIDAADAEDELIDALEELGIPEAWNIAEPLAAAGIDAAWLARVRELAGSGTEAAVQWVAATLTAHNLAADLTESTGRMSALVAAVKSYAHMDRGELVEADIHEGLETTLAVLGYKLKHTQVKLVRNYEPSLPKLTVPGGELNQVWTNLLDNAIDAIGEQGTITITTRLDGPCVEVDIADDGPGIAADVREHIFDPFFTTKEVGRGTGLGLDAARRIVTERHRGSISVDSEPGRTVFHVWLPIERRPPAQTGV